MLEFQFVIILISWKFEYNSEVYVIVIFGNCKCQKFPYSGNSDTSEITICQNSST